MIKTLTRHGDSLALVIDQTVLDLLGADAETSFDMTIDGKAITLAPVGKTAKYDGTFRNALEQVNARYANALQRLAE